MNEKQQSDITKAKPVGKSKFVAGWRPALGWVCVFGLGFNVVVAPYADLFLPKVTMVSNTEELVTVVLALLGMSGYRTVEKLKRAAREQ